MGHLRKVKNMGMERLLPVMGGELIASGTGGIRFRGKVMYIMLMVRSIKGRFLICREMGKGR